MHLFLKKDPWKHLRQSLVTKFGLSCFSRRPVPVPHEDEGEDAVEGRHHNISHCQV